MMKTTVISLALALTAAGALSAATAADVNGDGVLTLDEVQAVMPDITTEAFSAMDLNSDGALDDAQVQSAQDAGLMPA